MENPRPAISSDIESFETAQQTHECVCWFESAQMKSMMVRRRTRGREGGFIYPTEGNSANMLVVCLEFELVTAGFWR